MAVKKLTFLQLDAISNAFRQHINPQTGLYDSEWNDERVARDAGCKPEAVSKRRRELFPNSPRGGKLPAEQPRKAEPAGEDVQLRHMLKNVQDINHRLERIEKMMGEILAEWRGTKPAA